MRILILVAALAAVTVAPPAQPAAACTTPPIPVYPGALPTGGVDRFGDVTSLGRTYVATTEPLLSIQQFYYTSLPNSGWQAMTPMAGQHPQSFAGRGYTPNGAPEPVLEFSRANASQYVRIVGEGSGYTIVLDCRD